MEPRLQAQRLAYVSLIGAIETIQDMIPETGRQFNKKNIEAMNQTLEAKGSRAYVNLGPSRYNFQGKEFSIYTQDRCIDYPTGPCYAGSNSIYLKTERDSWCNGTWYEGGKIVDREALLTGLHHWHDNMVNSVARIDYTLAHLADLEAGLQELEERAGALSDHSKWYGISIDVRHNLY